MPRANTKHLLCAKEVQLFSPFYTWGNWVIENLGNLPKAIKTNTVTEDWTTLYPLQTFTYNADVVFLFKRLYAMISNGKGTQSNSPGFVYRDLTQSSYRQQEFHWLVLHSKLHWKKFYFPPFAKESFLFCCIRGNEQEKEVVWFERRCSETIKGNPCPPGKRDLTLSVFSLLAVYPWASHHLDTVASLLEKDYFNYLVKLDRKSVV